MSSLGSHTWEQEVLARLPKGWQEQAHTLKAFRRAHKVRCAGDLFRGILAYVLWMLQEEELVTARQLLQDESTLPDEVPPSCQMPEPEQGQTRAISEWMLAGLSLVAFLCH